MTYRGGLAARDAARDPDGVRGPRSEPLAHEPSAIEQLAKRGRSESRRAELQVDRGGLTLVGPDAANGSYHRICT